MSSLNYFVSSTTQVAPVPTPMPSTGMVRTTSPQSALRELDAILCRPSYPNSPPDVTGDETGMLWTLHALQNTSLITRASRQYARRECGMVFSVIGVVMSVSTTLVGLISLGMPEGPAYSTNVWVELAISAGIALAGGTSGWIATRMVSSKSLNQALDAYHMFWPEYLVSSLNKLVAQKLPLPPLLAVLHNALKVAANRDESKRLAIATFPLLTPQDVVSLLRLPGKLLSALPTPERPNVDIALDGDTEELLHRIVGAMGHDPVQAIEAMTSRVTCRI